MEHKPERAVRVCLRDGLRALLLWGNTRSLDLSLPHKRSAARSGARDDKVWMVDKKYDDKAWTGGQEILGRYFFGAALLAKFLEELFLAE